MNEKTFRLFIDLILCAFDKCDEVRNIEKVNWKFIYHFAKIHGIANIICYAIDKLKPKMATEIYILFKTEQIKAVRRDAIQDIEIKKIYNDYENMGIDAMVLKGVLIKEMYPSSDMRIMGDVDFLIRREDMDRASEYLLNNGYTQIIEEFAEGKEKDPHDEFQKPPLMLVELHRFLVLKDKYWDIYNYYEGIWSHTVSIEGYKHIYRMNDDEYYIFMIVHIMKHYVRAGVGIRYLLDVWVFLQNRTLNREYVDNVLKKLKLDKFEKEIINLCNNWFDKQGELNDFQKKMTDYIIAGGVYGTLKNYETNSIARADNAMAFVAKNLKNTIIPSYKAMCFLYPSLKKRPLLLPAYWIYRIIYKLKTKRENIKRNVLMPIFSLQTQKFKDHMETLGLYNR